MHELQIRNWRWYQRVRVGGRVAYRCPGRFQVYPWYSLRCPQENENMQETPRKGSDTKERILDLAEAAVLEKGFAATSSELRRAGCLSPVG